MVMKHHGYLNYLGLLLTAILLLGGCGGTTSPTTTVSTTTTASTTTTESPLTAEPGVLLPAQVSSSLLNQAVKVKGRVMEVIQDPGGQGGLYVKLGGDGSVVGVRIESADWDAMSAATKNQFETGKIATAAGILVQSGTDLVVVLKNTPETIISSTATPSSTETTEERPQKTTFIVKAPSNTPSYTTIYMEWYYKEDGYWSNNDNMIKMEKVADNTWQTEIALTPTGYGADGTYFCYRYSRDKWGYPAAEEFNPDSASGYRKIEITSSAGKTINDTISKWRWFPAPDEPALAIPPSAAGTAAIVPRINGFKFFRGIGVQDFWNESYGFALDGPTLEAIKADGADAVSFGAPVWTFSQIDPLPIITESSFYQLKGLESQLKLYHDAGFHISLCPQFGNSAEDPSLYTVGVYDNAHSQAWWDAWYSEVERVTLYTADLAEKYDVEMLAPCGGVLCAW
jgi:hypothetical protein